jgi:hypothetical protein
VITVAALIAGLITGAAPAGADTPPQVVRTGFISPLARNFTGCDAALVCTAVAAEHPGRYIPRYHSDRDCGFSVQIDRAQADVPGSLDRWLWVHCDTNFYEWDGTSQYRTLGLPYYRSNTAGIAEDPGGPNSARARTQVATSITDAPHREFNGFIPPEASCQVTWNGESFAGIPLVWPQSGTALPPDPALKLADGVTPADVGVLITFQNMCIRFPTATTPEMLKFGDTGVALWTWARAGDPAQAFVPPSTAGRGLSVPPERVKHHLLDSDQNVAWGLGAKVVPGTSGQPTRLYSYRCLAKPTGRQGCNMARTSLTGSTATDWPALQDAKQWQYLSIWGWVSFGVDAAGVGSPPPPNFVYNVLSKSTGDIPTGNVTIERSPVLNNRWVMIGAVEGLGDKVVLRTAPAPYGPWSSGFTFQLPDCTVEAVAGCYRPTLHPELDVAGEAGGLGLTWVELHGQSVYRVTDAATQTTQELKVQAMRAGYLPAGAVPPELYR